MKKVILSTESGEYVTTSFIPPFMANPKAILWGQRLFFYHSDEEYREGFWVAAMLTGQEIKAETQEQLKEEGNDDLLFGLPKDLDEAVETFIDFFRNATDMSSIVEMDEMQFRSAAHHGAGQFMRNSWFLWWYKNHGHKGWPQTKPPLIAWFNERGIYHADDMSGIITTSAFRKVNNRPIGLEEQIEHYINYWKEAGFSDGNPMTKK